LTLCRHSLETDLKFRKGEDYDIMRYNVEIVSWP